MTIVEIRKSLQGLSRVEKFQIIQELLEELQRDEKELSHYLDSKTKYACWSQHNAFDTASKLQEFLDQQR